MNTMLRYPWEFLLGAKMIGAGVAIACVLVSGCDIDRRQLMDRCLNQCGNDVPCMTACGEAIRRAMGDEWRMPLKGGAK